MLAAIAAALSAAASTLSAAARWCWWAVEWTVSVPGRLVHAMVPTGAGSVPPPPVAADVAPSAATEVGDLIAKRRRTPAPGLLPEGVAQRADGTDPVGEAVHRYAAATPATRAAVSLAALSPDQLGWLLRQCADQLERLALAGPHVCGRLAEGRKAGVPGVESCKRADGVELTESPNEEAVVTRLDLSPAGVAARIRGQRGLVRAA